MEFLVVFTGAGLGAYQDHLHAQEAEGLYQGEGFKRPAHVDGRFLAGQNLPVFLELGIENRQLLPDQRLGARHDLRVVEKPGHVIEGFGHILHSEIGDPKAVVDELPRNHLGKVLKTDLRTSHGVSENENI